MQDSLLDDHKLFKTRRQAIGGVSQKSIAAVAEMSLSAVSKFEQGTLKFVEPNRSKIWNALAWFENAAIESEKRKSAGEQERAKGVPLAALKGEPYSFGPFLEEMMRIGYFDPKKTEELKDAQIATLKKLVEAQQALLDADKMPLIDRLVALETEVADLRRLVGLKTEAIVKQSEADALQEEIEQNVRTKQADKP